MKTAYQYIRISDDDQSHFSIGGQQKMNIDFSERHNINILKTFIDEGYSAKNFNRPQWKEIEKELSKNRNKIDYLIVWKYDRLIRNAAEGLTFIEKLEKKWNIILISVMENFGIDPNSPYFFKHRADLLVSAEFERRLISDRTKMGNWSAKDGGRFIGRAPLGYINARDKKNLPVLEIHPEQKPVVEQIFSDFLNDVPYQVIKRKVNSLGIRFKGNDAIQRIISNQVYAGLICVPEYHGKKSYTKKGIHEPIIPVEVFWKAYYKLIDKTKPQGPKVVDLNVPLRGFVLCQGCGGYHTGGKSKGRSQHYYYYRCKKCNGENYNADKVHSEMVEILSHLSLEEKYIKALIIEAEKKLNKEVEGKSVQLKKLNTEFEVLSEKLNSLEEKYIGNKIAQDTYDKWYPVFSREVNSKSIELAELNKDNNKELEQYKNMLPFLANMEAIYKMATEVEDKQAFLKGIFWGGFTKEKKGGRTKLLNPIFRANSLKTGHLLRVENERKPENISGFPFSTRDGT